MIPNRPAHYVIASLLAVALTSAAQANPNSNWHQWRGPFATGVAPEGNPPVTWSETENVQWKYQIPGFGTSTPIVWGDRVFILTAIPVSEAASDPAPTAAAPASGAEAAAQATEERPRRGPRPGGGGGFGSQTPSQAYQFAVIAVDRQSGTALWQQVARQVIPHEGHHRDHGYASFSPVTDGEHLFAYFGSRGLHAYDLQGNKKWEKDFGQMRTRNAFGEGGSIALHGDTLIVNWDHEGDDFVAALDKRTGHELWRQPRDEISTWSTPLVVTYDGKPQVVINATTRIRSYDLATGELIWECGGMTQNVIPTPVTDSNLLYALSGFRGNALLAIRLGRTGDLTDSDAIAWRHNRHTPYVPSPLLYENRLYFFSGNTGMLSIFNAQTGDPVVEAERISNLPGVYASPVAAAGRVYLVGREGQTVVLKQSDTLETLASNRLDDRFDASGAIVGRQLFLRGHQHLYCLAEQ
jgi:outer membrane protein assembly factor BamB